MLWIRAKGSYSQNLIFLQLMNRPNVCPWWAFPAENYEHSTLLLSFISYKEIEVLSISSLTPYSTLACLQKIYHEVLTIILWGRMPYRERGSNFKAYCLHLRCWYSQSILLFSYLGRGLYRNNDQHFSATLLLLTHPTDKKRCEA